MCGENFSIPSANLQGVGSPPHVRGKHLIKSGTTYYNGITPACAGKTLPSCSNTLNHRDHPRMCGENRLQKVLLLRQEGSPPHVRGKLDGRQGCVQVSGITPACAGKTKMNTYYGVIN